MGIGFIPRDESHGADDVGKDGARRQAEAIETWVTMMIDACCEALLKQVRKYAEQLEGLDPLHHNAEQDVCSVVLMLSYDENAQERMGTLISEARLSCSQ